MAESQQLTEARLPLSPLMVMVLNGRSLEARLQDHLQEQGLSMRRLGLLGHLKASPGISFSGLARRAGIRVQSLQPIVAGMLSDGLVRTVGGVGQGKAAVLELTDAGVDALRAVGATVAALEEEIFVGEAWGSLAAALRKVGEEEFTRLSAARRAAS